MIAKFKTDCGWSYHECTKVNTDVNPPDGPEDLNGCFVFGLGPEDQSLKRAKRAYLTTADGKVDRVVYGMEAYLMNDEGHTVQAL